MTPDQFNALVFLGVMFVMFIIGLSLGGGGETFDPDWWKLDR